MNRTEQIVRLSEFLDRHRGRLMSLPGVTEVGVGPRTMVDTSSDLVVQIFVRSQDEAMRVRERASAMMDPHDVEVFVKGNLEPLRF
jgi:hypothetical protein